MAERIYEFLNLRGGRNDSDPPHLLSEDQAVEMLNVDAWEGSCGNKRGGAAALGMTFSSGGPFTAAISSVLRHVPGIDETAAEFWAVDSANVVGRLAASTQWIAPTVVDASSSGLRWVGASFNGYHYLAYDSSQNRLHVWDPGLSKVRRVGLATPDPPTTATLGGAGLTFTRYYRIRTVHLSGSTALRRSEPSTVVSQSITDDSGIRVTRPTLPTSEDETHWEVEYADAAAGPFYRASQVATGTSTYDDSAASISTTTLSPSTGLYLPPPSFRYMVATESRIVGTGCHETSGGYTEAKNNRVWWIPALGSIAGDLSERVVSNTAVGAGYLDVEAATTGIGLLGSTIYVFSYRRIWALEPTGQPTAPFRKFSLDTGGIGCIDHQSIVLAEDENGTPCLYFASAKGIYRIGPNGLQYCGGDNETLWATVNLGATGIGCFGLYYPAKHQIWWWLATGSSDNADTKLAFDTKLGRTVSGDAVRKGWFKHTGHSAVARCAVLFSNTVGATMSRDLKPYIGYVDAVNTIWKCDTADTTDAGNNFQAYSETREVGKLGWNHAIDEGVLIAQANSGVSIAVTAITDFGFNQDAAATVSLTPDGAESRVNRRLQALQTAGVGTFRFRIGDTGANANQWTVEGLIVRVTEEEVRF